MGRPKKVDDSWKVGKVNDNWTIYTREDAKKILGLEDKPVKEKQKTRRTYKSKTPLNEHQAKKKRVAQKKEEREDQLQAREIVGELFKDHLPEFIEKRKQDFEEMFKVFQINNEDKFVEGNSKISQGKLSNLLSKPLTAVIGASTAISASELLTCSQCYWDCVNIANESITYVPSIEQFCGMMGMSSKRLIQYYYSNDQELSEAAEMIKDRFIDWYTINGMTNRVNSIMAMFTMKARFGLRDNDTPPVVINNQTTTVPQDEISKLAARYDKIIDVDFDEV